MNLNGYMKFNAFMKDVLPENDFLVTMHSPSVVLSFYGPDRCIKCNYAET
jgi:hypothetical protein